MPCCHFQDISRMTPPTDRNDEHPDDPVFLHTRREAIVILVVWALAFSWVVPFCYFDGYTPAANATEVPLVLGMPRWVVWGVGVPWLIADVVTIGLCLWFIKDDDLEG